MIAWTWAVLTFELELGNKYKVTFGAVKIVSELRKATVLKLLQD